MSRIPNDAFDFYVALGAERSYQAVADRYDVTKRAVTARAKAEDWPGRLAKIEATAREDADKKLAQTIGEMHERHLKTVRAIQGRALEGLRAHPLTSGIEAVRAAELAIKLERLIVGEPSERTALSVEDVVRREYERWMRPEADNDAEG